jgi:hypothetical protein
LLSNDKGIFTKPLPSNKSRIHIDTQADGKRLRSAPFRWAQVAW